MMSARGLTVISIRHVVRIALLFGEVLEQLLDPILMADALVELEADLGRARKAQALSDLTPHEPGGALERAGGVLSRGGIAEAGVIDPRVLQIGADFHTRDGDEADAGIV